MPGGIQNSTPGATAFAGASTSLNYCEIAFTGGLNPHSKSCLGEDLTDWRWSADSYLFQFWISRWRYRIWLNRKSHWWNHRRSCKAACYGHLCSSPNESGNGRGIWRIDQNIECLEILEVEKDSSRKKTWKATARIKDTDFSIFMVEIKYRYVDDQVLGEVDFESAVYLQ